MNSVFGNDDLRRIILNYIVNDRCISCHQIMHNRGDHINYNDYRNDEWRNKSNKFDKKCCNWCYYYVWERPY